MSGERNNAINNRLGTMRKRLPTVSPTMPQTPEQRIAQLESELAAQRAEMQDFTSTVSHDLRASLRHITSYTRLVQEDAGPQLSAEVQGFLGTIADSAMHLGVLMDGLMELSRLGTVPLNLEPLPLQVALEAAVAGAQQKLKGSDPARVVRWHLADDLPTVQGDAGMVALALAQVLDNACKFTANTADAVLTLSAHADAAAGTVCLTIADNGAGFNPALVSKLFHPFQRLHTVKQFPGIGMGLALTRKAMQRMGGSVTAQGQVGQGCTVQLVFRAA